MALSDFVSVPVQAGKPQRLIMSVWGREKQGKTAFALSAPAPIYVFDLDRRLDGPRRLYPTKNIMAKKYRDPLLGGIADHEKIYEEFLGDLREAVRYLKEGTVVIDPVTQVWTMVQSVYVEKVRKQKSEEGKKFMTFDYALANRHFQEVIEVLKDNPSINIVLISRAEEAYDQGGQRTGTYRIQSHKSVPYMVDMTLRCEKTKEGVFQVVIEESGIASAIPGLVLPGMIIEDPKWENIGDLLG